MTPEGVITQIEKPPPLIELCQVRQEIGKQFVLALDERGQRRQELIVFESTQSITISRRSCRTRLFQWLSVASAAVFSRKTHSS